MIPKGFKFASARASIKNWKKPDIGLIVSDRPCKGAGVFTKNLAKAAPVLLSMESLAHPTHRAIICNSGCANAATGKKGMENARRMGKLTAEQIGCKPEQVLVASTGVIGEHLPMEKIEKSLPLAAKNLVENGTGFAKAIMTTDTKMKTAFKTVKLNGKDVVVWGSAKGSGMIHPNMATMLGFLITDAAVPKNLLKKILKDAADNSFNRITVDGDTSTNDSLYILANGAAGNAPIKNGSSAYKKLSSAITDVCKVLAEKIVIDGEGAKRIAEIKVDKAASVEEAEAVALSISGSLLVKTALHGMDPNWGRIICAAGYSGADIDIDKTALYFGPYCAFRKGMPVKDMEDKLAREMKKKKVHIRYSLNRGKASATRLFCDLSRDYVTINADYRS